MWTKIRTFGELQILTRASYAMLIFVPLLAGMWPAVKSGINRYNTVVTEARSSLDTASDRLEFIATTIESNSEHKTETSRILVSLQKNLDSIIQDYSLKTFEKNSMPAVWALSLLASLSVMVAHLVYEATAPALIKQVTLQNHVNRALKAFVEHPSNIQLERAKTFSDYSDESVAATYSSALEDYLGANARSEEDRDREKKRRQELGIIEQGAVSEYTREANQARIAAVISGVFYAIGMLLLLYIISTQTINVVRATW